MRTKNAKTISKAESEHMALVKSVACGWCDGAGGYAHHIRQGLHWVTVATCWECHQGPQGWHGDKTLSRIFKRDELDALNITIERVDELKRQGQ
jgi:hypothetical protein